MVYWQVAVSVIRLQLFLVGCRFVMPNEMCTICVSAIIFWRVMPGKHCAFPYVLDFECVTVTEYIPDSCLLDYDSFNSMMVMKWTAGLGISESDINILCCHSKLSSFSWRAVSKRNIARIYKRLTKTP